MPAYVLAELEKLAEAWVFRETPLPYEESGDDDIASCVKVLRAAWNMGVGFASARHTLEQRRQEPLGDVPRREVALERVVEVVRECLAEHDAARDMFDRSRRDAPITARVRAALAQVEVPHGAAGESPEPEQSAGRPSSETPR